MSGRKFLGIVVSPVNVQTEGLDRVLENLVEAGADAIAIDPWLLAPGTPENGARMPDLHIDGHARLVTRPVWGRRELYVRAYLAFEPCAERYGAGPYLPSWQPPPPDLDPSLPKRMIEAFRKRGLQVHIGFAPLLVPGRRAEDQPVLVTGEALPPPWIAQGVCPNNPAGRRYALGFIEDLVHHYPEIDGLILDWAEFGAYRLEEHFTCFCSHCETRARRSGVDWEMVRRDVNRLWNWLHALGSAGLEASRQATLSGSIRDQLLRDFPGIAQFLRFKAASVTDFYRMAADRLRAIGRPDLGLTARGWCPPWNLSSGMDYAELSQICTAVAPKLFTFDHAVLPRWLAETLLAWNPGLEESQALDAAVAWLQLPDDLSPRRLAQYSIPAPGQPPPARFEAYRMRLERMAAQTSGDAACLPITHPYLPEGQWAEMVSMVRASPVDGMWVNFYSYLSDGRFQILKERWS